MSTPLLQAIMEQVAANPPPCELWFERAAREKRERAKENADNKAKKNAIKQAQIEHQKLLREQRSQVESQRLREQQAQNSASN